MKNSFLMPSFEGGMKTPKSCKEQKKTSQTEEQANYEYLIGNVIRTL